MYSYWFLAVDVICSSTKDTVNLATMKKKVKALNSLRSSREACVHGQH